MSQTQTQAIIANGAAVSPQVNLGNGLLIGIRMPATWTAAVLTFQVSPDGGTTWLEMQSSSAVVSYTVAQGQYIGVDPTIWRGVTALKVRSGTVGSPVNQAQQSIVTLITQ
jgi:hypothetical protein